MIGLHIKYSQPLHVKITHGKGDTSIDLGQLQQHSIPSTFIQSKENMTHSDLFTELITMSDTNIEGTTNI